MLHECLICVDFTVTISNQKRVTKKYIYSINQKG